jgi:serine/threonine protein kinase
MVVVRLPKVEDFHGDEIPGTPSFMAPEQFEGNAGDALTDQFALGVTLYRWFTGHWPYGEQEAFQRPKFGKAPPPSKHRPEIPSWLDDAILTAIQPDRRARFGDVIELLRALENGGSLRRRQTRGAPLIERNPVLVWQLVSAALAVALAVSLLSPCRWSAQKSLQTAKKPPRHGPGWDQFGRRRCHAIS